eukprot:TRINITY_DN13131_c0_g1_i2.p1 TRINITY_DN13131_c0_g1~~TRINITY_DN13131_c0_g1_i2.p1  ORF type:complete len:394 (+),score=77.41 TRINITY_DN13131_c0_g1_i2:86-1267(+)
MSSAQHSKVEQSLRDEIEEWKAAALVLEEEKKILLAQQTQASQNIQEQVQITESILKRLLLALNATLYSTIPQSSGPIGATHLDMALQLLDETQKKMKAEEKQDQVTSRLIPLLWELTKDLPSKISKLKKGADCRALPKLQGDGPEGLNIPTEISSVLGYGNDVESLRLTISILQFEIDRKDSIIQQLRAESHQSSAHSTVHYLTQRNQRLEQENKKLLQQLTEAHSLVPTFHQASHLETISDYQNIAVADTPQPKNSGTQQHMHTHTFTYAPTSTLPEDDFSAPHPIPSYVTSQPHHFHALRKDEIDYHAKAGESTSFQYGARAVDPISPNSHVQSQFQHLNARLQETSRRLQSAENQVQQLKVESRDSIQKSAKGRRSSVDYRVTESFSKR